MKNIKNIPSHLMTEKEIDAYLSWADTKGDELWALMHSYTKDSPEYNKALKEFNEIAAKYEELVGEDL